MISDNFYHFIPQSSKTYLGFENNNGTICANAKLGSFLVVRRMRSRCFLLFRMRTSRARGPMTNSASPPGCGPAWLIVLRTRPEQADLGIAAVARTERVTASTLPSARRASACSERMVSGDGGFINVARLRSAEATCCYVTKPNRKRLASL